MSKTIHKYPIERGGVIRLPFGATVIHFGADPHGKSHVWAIVDPSELELEERLIETFGTGHKLPEDTALQHLETKIDGPFVWHTFIEQGKRQVLPLLDTWMNCKETDTWPGWPDARIKLRESFTPWLPAGYSGGTF